MIYNGYKQMDQVVTPEDLGEGEAGEYIEDTAYFFGSCTFSDEANWSCMKEFESTIGELVSMNPEFVRVASKAEGHQLAVIVEGDLRIDFPLHVGDIIVESGGFLKHGISFGVCLNVKGSLYAPAIFVEQNSHASIGNDLHVPYVQIAGGDGESLFCGGNAYTSHYVCNQPYPETKFVTPPFECKVYEVREEYRANESALLLAIEEGMSIV